MNEFAQALTSLVWAMESRALQRLIAQVAAVTDAQIEHTIRAINEKPELLERLHARSGNHAQNTRRRSADVSEGDLDIRNGVAHIAIVGPMMKQVPSILNFLDIKATSTEAVRAELEAAIFNDRVESIMLDIDSPGGTVDGTASLADDVYAARGMKPITARVDDLMASAALWVGSQAERIDAGPSAAVGSIGVYAVVDDQSRKFEKAGIRTHVVSSGELKGAFVAGSQITDTQLGDLQRNIDTYNDLFVEAVARGRIGLGEKPEDADQRIRDVATGQMWIGLEAMAAGLVDSVDSGAGGTAGDGRSILVSATGEEFGSVEEVFDHFGLITEISDRELAQRNAATAAQQGTETMTDEEKREMDQLRADNAALKTKVDEGEAATEAAETKLRAEKVAKRDALLEQYADRVHPAVADSVSQVVHRAGTHEQAERYLRELPPITRPDRESVVPDDMINAIDDPGLRARLGHKALAGEAKVAAFLGTTERRVDRVDALVEGALSDGKFQLKDGRVVTKEELQGLLQ